MFVNIVHFLKKTGLLLIIYSICRMLFYCFNLTYFADTPAKELITCLFYGLRFDLATIAMTNSLFILLFFIPFPFRYAPAYRKLLHGIFYLINTVAILLNCSDIIYFKFIFKRSSTDVFELMTTGSDFISLLPVFIVDYWYIALVWLLLVTILVYRNRKTEKKYVHDENGKFNYAAESLVFILFMGISVLAYRGGFQLKPVSIISAGAYGPAKNIPLIINTPFSILKTMETPNIPEKKYLPEQELKSICNPIVQFHHKEFRPLNVVVIIMESYSKEYVGALNGGRGYTPFLDSLITKSLLLTNAFANGKKSMEGIPAILAGIPALMTEPYITSNYAGNNITSLGNLLKNKGYSTSFYHGGSNGTMGFDAFTKLAGFEKYYGRTEYNNDADYDGHWGIWDEPFFQYFAHRLDQTPEPFLSVFFSLSSHHPYEIPELYKQLFKEEKPIHKSMRYADLSLRKFFDTASEMQWFNNTLFIITADHTGDAESAMAANRLGMYQIPVVFYKPHSELKGTYTGVTQQSDIMPSVLDYLGYSEPFFAFGKSIFDPGNNQDSSKRFAINYINESYQIIGDNHALQFDGTRSNALFNYKKDSLLTNNLVESDTVTRKILERHVKAIAQVFNYSLIHNKMTAAGDKE